MQSNRVAEVIVYGKNMKVSIPKVCSTAEVLFPMLWNLVFDELLDALNIVIYITGKYAGGRSESPRAGVWEG